jgi:hypothetical protein
MLPLPLALFWDGRESNPSSGLQPIPSVTEKCYSVRLFRRTVPGSSLPVPTVSDPSVTKCVIREFLFSFSGTGMIDATC